MRDATRIGCAARTAEAAAADLTIDDGGRRKEGGKEEREGGRQHFVALKTALNASLLQRKGGRDGGEGREKRGSADYGPF